MIRLSLPSLEPESGAIVMAAKGEKQIAAYVRALLDKIDYDFSQFTLEGFAHWLEERRGRKIIFVPFHFKRAHTSGAWLADEAHDYIFHETQDAPPVLQAHSQLHEIAHILCGHSTAQVAPEEVALLLSHSGEHNIACSSLLFRSTQNSQSDEEELEAEMLASLIQERVLSNSRLQELFKTVSSDIDVATYIKNLNMS